MPVELDLTGCCRVCYMPLVAALADSKVLCKACPWDASHTPQPKLRGDAFGELAAVLTADLRVERPATVGGAELALGAELLVEPGQAFWIKGPKKEPFDPPDRLEGLQEVFAAAEGRSLQIVFRNPRPPGDPLLGGRPLEADPDGDEGVRLLPPLDSPQQRQDPADGARYTFRELQERYAKELGADEIREYWTRNCTASTGRGARGRGRGRGGGRGADTASAATVHAAAKVLELPRIAPEANGLVNGVVNGVSHDESAALPAVAGTRGRGRGRGQTRAAADAPAEDREALASAPEAPPEQEQPLEPEPSQGRGRGRGRGRVAPAPAEALDALAWLNGIDAAGNLADYAPSIGERFSSMRDLRECYESRGSKEFYELLGVKKVGHKRMLDKAISEIAA